MGPLVKTIRYVIALGVLVISGVLSGCSSYSVNISNDQRASEVIGKCFLTVRKLKLTQALDGDSSIYLESGEKDPSEKFFVFVPEGTQIVVRRVDEYHHAVNGVFYDPIIEVSIDQKDYLVKAWHVFSMETDKPIRPVTKYLRPCSSVGSK